MTVSRVGVIGTDNTHAYTYCAFINGWSESEAIPVRLPNGAPVPDMYLWATLLRRLENDPTAKVPLPDIQVTSIWSEVRADAERIARACGISTVCDSPEQVCDDVDAVMVLSERPATHLPYARFALKRGLPTYVDKPLADDLETGEEIFALADRFNAPCYTGSALRWSPEFLAVREQARAQDGNIKAVHVSCPLGLELYGIHAVELVNLFLGHEADTVRAVGAPGRQTVLLAYPHGSTAVFEHLNFVHWPVYSVTLHTESWHHHITINDPAPTLLAFIRHFAEFARGGPVPASPAESLRLIEIVAAAERSLREGHQIQL